MAARGSKWGFFMVFKMAGRYDADWAAGIHEYFTARSMSGHFENHLRLAVPPATEFAAVDPRF